MSQNAAVLEMLQSGPVTPIDALREAGCFRLAARVCELREMGFEIETNIHQADGQRYAVYSLKKTNAA